MSKYFNIKMLEDSMESCEGHNKRVRTISVKAAFN